MSKLAVRKATARAHSQADRLDEAIQIFSSILQEYPDDFDSYLFIGDCYLASNDPYNAIQVYKQALGLQPDDTEVQLRIELAENEFDPMNVATPVMQPTQPAALERLIQRLSRNALKVTPEEITEAQTLIQQLSTSSHPGDEVINVLDDIDSLLPALLELNIRQARASGRYDVVNELRSLMYSSENRKSPKAVSQDSTAAVFEQPGRQARRIFLMTPDAETPYLQLARQSLEQQGYFVHTSDETQRLQAHIHSSDAVIVHRPDAGEEYGRAIALAAGIGIPIVLCVDEGNSPCSPSHKNELVAQQLADQIVVPSNAMADQLGESGYQNVTYMPPAWDQEDPNWRKARAKDREVTLGWFSATGTSKDIASIRRVVIRVMREFPEIKLLIAGDSEAYASFDVLADERKVFLPSDDTSQLAKQLGQVDILLLPYEESQASQCFSDKNVLYAGVRGLPWIATPLPDYQDWASTGLLASSQEDWHTYLRQLVMDKDLRQSLGEQGTDKAQTREIQVLSSKWHELIESLFANH